MNHQSQAAQSNNKQNLVASVDSMHARNTLSAIKGEEANLLQKKEGGGAGDENTGWVHSTIELHDEC